MVKKIREGTAHVELRAGPLTLLPPRQPACRPPTRGRAKALFGSPTLTYVFGHDDSFRTDQKARLLTLAGRIHIPYQGWSRHTALIQHGALIGGAKLWYDQAKKRFYLLVSLTIQTPDPASDQQPQVLGMDVGQRSLARVATLSHGAAFFSGKEARAKADHSAGRQKRLEPHRHSQRDESAYYALAAGETVEAE